MFWRRHKWEVCFSKHQKIIVLPPSQGIRRPCFTCFFTKICSKYIQNVGIKLASLKIMFQYRSNDTNFTQYNQVLVALFIQSKFALEYACALFIETEVVSCSKLSLE
jgi:hypothetical protein